MSLGHFITTLNDYFPAVSEDCRTNLAGYSTGSIASGIKLPLIEVKHDGRALESAF
jgi:hypothetical protein